jgi:hypothetical protein
MATTRRAKLRGALALPLAATAISMAITTYLHQNLEREDSRIRGLQKLHYQKGNRARIGISWF